jgi:hypothetical protein
MAAVSSNGGGDGRKQSGGGKERHNDQIEAMAAAGGNNKYWRSTAEMDNMVFEGVGDVQWRSTETAMVRRGDSKRQRQLRELS